MKINNITSNSIYYKGALDGLLTMGLRTLDTNPMVNAAGIDIGSMGIPRAWIDTKHRNPFAGFETIFREATGTIIVCFSASWFAKLITKLMNRTYKPKTKINTDSWFSNQSIEFFKSMNERSSAVQDFINNTFNSISGIDGTKIIYFRNIDWNKIEWIDEKLWSKYQWDNKNFNNTYKNLKDKNSIINMISEFIQNKEISPKDSKKILNILEVRLTNALGAGKIIGENGSKEISCSMYNLLRDMTDFGRDILINPNIKTNEAINKILKINKTKTAGAMLAASILGLTNQYINRKITEFRTGTKGFVGDIYYKDRLQTKNSNVDKSRRLVFEKILACTGMAGMAIAVMRIKSPQDFFKKLEFIAPVTSGNIIKTVYGATLIGRFAASDSEDELLESSFRDFFGFLNWLVFGGFTAKGTANLLDKKRKNLFNISGKGKGIKHWLNNISLKSHNEIAAKGEKFAKKNMWKLNASHLAGIAYSTITLGVLLPKINIAMTKYRQRNKKKITNP